ncbi:aryl-alcohol dehydrogenase-like predicted oxidoreductase [Kineosphaera limosa]|uniref:Putative aldo/keto reductase n=1 Tax=Kineosphaera limosa NBRC 100340 TaxID=1184609 RepID=K6VFQ4_9MICO|nr:aldo/keto reductase [Kineosphaera limosa]NYE00511.1 aryl-alcohol dehydrogenase-like predicted oxidoreductase [Kineosphaera limosa]GAB95023.1 putative aldo/keto reductase [Kineosphaera limosa NBRC 100340]
MQYSLVHRKPERELLPFAQLERRLVIAYSPLAQGLLSARHTSTDRVTGVRAANPHFLPENLDAAQPLFAVLREVADAHDATPAQVALAWVIRNPQVAAVPGASSVAQLKSNVAAADLTLADDEIDALSRASDAYQPLSGWRSVPRVARSIIGSRSAN